MNGYNIEGHNGKWEVYSEHGGLLEIFDTFSQAVDYVDTQVVMKEMLNKPKGKLKMTFEQKLERNQKLQELHEELGRLKFKWGCEEDLYIMEELEDAISFVSSRIERIEAGLE